MLRQSVSPRSDIYASVARRTSTKLLDRELRSQQSRPTGIVVLATLTAMSLGLGSNPGEDMDVCKCIVPSWHGGTLNSRRAASPLVKLVEGP
ncbi:hypothetical protein TNCV_2194821 [Trichonephila clavipes]|uniref:Uncharacterized protein n=1 Tax=Trichonephila clavipes TaxID=2585209 RepID=A0A8X6SCJ7_TRICX|nr:hypothetical protein TNCV_2194821 [Trichonephila clavipes]